MVVNNHSSPNLLTTYNEERLPVVAEMLRKVIGLYNAFTKDAHKALTSAAHPVELFQLDINYRWSSILIEDRNPPTTSLEELKAHAYLGWGTDLCAGDRAPDAPELVVAHTPDSITLFDVFNPTMHTVLVFGSLVSFPNLDSIIRSRSPVGAVQTFVVLRDSSGAGATAIHDKAGHAYSAYGVGSNSSVSVIVRPDGFIGCITTSEPSVEKYFSLIFSK